MFATMRQMDTPRQPQPPLAGNQQHCSSNAGSAAATALPAHLPGIDQRAGLATSMGRSELYRRMLGRFRAGHGNFRDGLRGTPGAGRRSRSRRARSAHACAAPQAISAPRTGRSGSGNRAGAGLQRWTPSDAEIARLLATRSNRNWRLVLAGLAVLDGAPVCWPAAPRVAGQPPLPAAGSGHADARLRTYSSPKATPRALELLERTGNPGGRAIRWPASCARSASKSSASTLTPRCWHWTRWLDN
jgi:hypothetical protein